MKISEFLKKLQNLSLKAKKFILWTAIIILAFGLLFWWINNLQKRLANFEGEEFIERLQLPKFEEKLKEMPKIEMPKIEIPEILEKEPQELKETIE